LAEPRPAPAAMSAETRQPPARSPPGLVITEAAMCAHCFDSIVTHLLFKNGVATVSVAPSFPNGS
jgi:hypothetical protein